MHIATHALIDPSLQDAVEHWNAYASDSVRTELVVLRLYTPIKDSLQITQQVVSTLEDGDWNAAPGLPTPEALSAVAGELADIQVAACGRLLDAATRYLNTGAEAVKLLGDAAQTDGTPQQQLAAGLEAGLAVAKQYQDDLSQQLSDLGAIQAACKAWWQKSFETLYG